MKQEQSHLNCIFSLMQKYNKIKTKILDRKKPKPKSQLPSLKLLCRMYYYHINYESILGTPEQSYQLPV